MDFNQINQNQKSLNWRTVRKRFVVCYVLFLFVLLLNGCQKNFEVQNSNKVLTQGLELGLTKDVDKDVDKDLVKDLVNDLANDRISDAANDNVDARSFLERSIFEGDIKSDNNLGSDADEDIDNNLEINSIVNSYDHVLGGIIPHHTVAHQMINRFYQGVSRTNAYDLIIVISPNHQSVGPRFQIALRDYTTFEGTVKVDKLFSQELINSTSAVEAFDEVLEKEHGQLVHMHYIRHYFKDVPVVSVMINETRDYKDIEVFRDNLAQLTQDKNVLIIGSIDFSHYLTLEQANKNDEKTLIALRTNDSRTLIDKSNDFIDSPSTYALVIEYLRIRGYFETSIVEHSNSARILNRLSLKETTSYFAVLYLNKSAKNPS